jgi:hypothetical protein
MANAGEIMAVKVIVVKSNTNKVLVFITFFLIMIVFFAFMGI